MSNPLKAALQRSVTFHFEYCKIQRFCSSAADATYAKVTVIHRLDVHVRWCPWRPPHHEGLQVLKESCTASCTHPAMGGLAAKQSVSQLQLLSNKWAKGWRQSATSSITSWVPAHLILEGTIYQHTASWWSDFLTKPTMVKKIPAARTPIDTCESAGKYHYQPIRV